MVEFLDKNQKELNELRVKYTKEFGKLNVAKEKAEQIKLTKKKDGSFRNVPEATLNKIKREEQELELIKQKGIALKAKAELIATIYPKLRDKVAVARNESR
jgi:hypothetical protein